MSKFLNLVIKGEPCVICGKCGRKKYSSLCTCHKISNNRVNIIPSKKEDKNEHTK